MTNPDVVEFYRVDSHFPFATLASSMQPAVGEVVSILGQSWVVVSRNFAVDSADDPRYARMRLALNVKPKRAAKKAVKR